MSLTIRHRAHLNQIHLVTLDALTKRRPVPTRLAVWLFAVMLAALISMVLP